jgi:tetratricopeptide (TPR) repeat protein
MSFKKVICLLFFILSHLTRGQTAFLDSLKGELKNANDDTVRCRILNTLIDSEQDDNIWPLYNDTLQQICKRNLKGLQNPRNARDTLFTSYLCIAYNNRGYVYQNHGNYTQAIAEFNKCIDMGRKIGDEASLSMTYNNLGGIYGDQLAYDEALGYFFKSMELRKKLGDRIGLSQSYLNIANMYEKKEDSPKEAEYTKKSLQLSIELGEMARVALIYNNQGMAYKKWNDYNNAINYFNRAIAIHDSMHNKRGLAVVYGNLSQTYVSTGESGKARAFALKALDLARELGYPSHIMHQASTLFVIESKEHNWETALGYYILQIQMRDSLANVENKKAVIMQQLKFEFDKQKAVEEANHHKELLVSAEREQKQRAISIAVGFVLLLMGVFAVVLYKRLRLTNRQKKIISEQKHLVEDKQKEILDSIRYAKRIQSAHLPSEVVIEKTLKSLKKS